MCTTTVEGWLADLLPPRDHATIFRLLQEREGLGGLRRLNCAEMTIHYGLSPDGARRLVAALALGTQAVQTALPDRMMLTEPAHIAQLHADLGACRYEEIRVMCLNAKHQLIEWQMVARGDVASCQVTVATIFHPAVRCAAAAMVLVHNHPSGAPEASREDMWLTKEVTNAGRLLQIRVLDHIIVAQGGRWWSMRERNGGIVWE